MSINVSKIGLPRTSTSIKLTGLLPSNFSWPLIEGRLSEGEVCRASTKLAQKFASSKFEGQLDGSFKEDNRSIRQSFINFALTVMHSVDGDTYQSPLPQPNVGRLDRLKRAD